VPIYLALMVVAFTEFFGLLIFVITTSIWMPAPFLMPGNQMQCGLLCYRLSCISCRGCPV